VVEKGMHVVRCKDVWRLVVEERLVADAEAQEYAKDVKGDIDWAPNRTVVAGRLDTALVQEYCTPSDIDPRPGGVAPDWWCICG